MSECCQKVPILVQTGLLKGQTIYVPCGKCANCLEHKQNEFLVKSYRAAIHFGRMWMLSLTYSPDKVHISGCLAMFEGGEVESHSKPFLCDDLRKAYFNNAPTGEYTDSRGRVHTFYKPCWLPVEKQNGIESRMYLMQSYDKKDVQNVIKYFRIKYEREFGKCPNFKYVIVPEYGGLTLRPHFHLCIYGLDPKSIYYLKALWQKRHGFCDVKRVKLVNDDNSDGFAKMSAYVSKYITKGLFEDQLVLKGFAFKPRITSSRYLGLESAEGLDKLRTWHLAFDRAGKSYRVEYPFVNPREFIDKTNGEVLHLVTPASESVDLIQRIIDRMYINLNGYKYPIPKSFKNVIYGTYSKTKKRYTASTLSVAIGAFLQARAVECLQSELAKLETLPDGTKNPASVCRVTNDFYFGSANDTFRARERIKRYYQRSKIV